jgi:hypothetical protein
MRKQYRRIPHLIFEATCMVSADLLRERGVADYVARGLGIAAQQADVPLQAMHSGVSVDEAAALAGIKSGFDHRSRPGSALGHLVK